MKIAGLTDFSTPSGLLAIIEAEFEAVGFREVMGWLREFYRSKSKELHDKEYWQSSWHYNHREKKKLKRWAHEVIQNGDVVGIAIMEYLGQEKEVKEGKEAKLQKFGFHFNNPDSSATPNRSERDNFRDYFHQYIFEARGYTLPS